MLSIRKIGVLSRTYRHINRYRQILRVMFKYGFGDLVDTLKIETVWLNVYLGGSWTARSDHHLYIDNVVIARKYIGPLQSEAPR